MFLFFSALLYTQETYSINQYGPYIIDSGVLIKIPSRSQALQLVEFKNNYALFRSWYGGGGFTLFNIKNNAIIELRGERFIRVPKIIDDTDYISIFQNEYIIKLDLETLELLEITHVGRLYDLFYNYQSSWEIPTPVRVGERLVRYESESNSIHILYGTEIDMDKLEDYFFIYDTTLDRYAIRVHILPDR